MTTTTRHLAGWVLVAMLAAFSGNALAQQWEYAYLLNGARQITRAELTRGDAGKYRLQIFFPNPDYCYRGTQEAEVEYLGNAIRITPKVPGNDCVEGRLIIRINGSGGFREIRRTDGKWARDAIERGLVPIGTTAAWYEDMLKSKSGSQASIDQTLKDVQQAVASTRPAPQSAQATAAAPQLVPNARIAAGPVEAQRAEPQQKLSQAPLPTAQKAAAAPKVKVRALVIGNSAYTSFGRLPNPRNDAEAIAAKFRAMGIQVDLLLDADRDSFVKALNDYSARATGHDINILYYAGHGVQVEGINYLVPTNMRADGISAGYIKLSGISLNAALDYMPGTTRLVFLDACRDNPASRSLVATRSAGAAGLAPVSTASGTLIAYATKDGATAEDGQGKHSPYTAALLEHLDRPDDIAVVLRRVRQTVMRLTSNRQEPWEYGSLVGDQLILSQLAR